MIDTVAAVTNVSTRFAEQFPQSVKPWKGPEVSLANGQVLTPVAGIKVKVILQGKSSQIFALILPLPNVDILLGNDILRQFGDIKVHCGKLKEKHDERTITIPAQQETHIMLQLCQYTSFLYSRYINETRHKCKPIWKSMGRSQKRALVWDIL